MSHLKYFTAAAVERLRANVAEQLDWYYEPRERWVERGVGAVRESRLPGGKFESRLVTRDGGGPYGTDRENALVVYRALDQLTPHQASIERLWVYLCHCECPKYVSWRWLGHRPKGDREAARKVRNHFFATGNRALVRDNGLSRLWWLGKIAHDIDPEEPETFLKILLHRQDVRSALIERPSVSMNPRVLSNIYQVMKESWEDGGDLFRRDVFRSWMVALNRRGGVVLLDALRSGDLDELIRIEAQAAVAGE